MSEPPPRRLAEVIAKPERLVAGLMTGTSMDGLDIAICRIGRGDPPRLLELVRGEGRAWPSSFRDRLLSAAELPVSELCRLDRQLGLAFADALSSSACGLALDLVGSHGQTVHHEHGVATLQLGEPGFIAAALGCPVVADFRRQDIVAGGCGAPLVAAVDGWLLARDDGPVLALNLGGIANLTVVPQRGAGGPALGFDCGPASMVLDELARRFTDGRRQRDEDGALAARGSVDRHLLDELLRDPIFDAPPPRSLGREQFGAAYVDRLLQRRPPADEGGWLDLFATLTELTARTVADGCRRWGSAAGVPIELVAAGGGTKNPQLMRRLAHAIAPLPLITSDARGLSSTYKEAIAFALLASARLDGVPGNVPAVTGAAMPVLLGKIVED